MSDDVNLVNCKQGEQTLPRGRKCDRTLRIFAVVRSDKQGGLFGPLRHGSTCEVPEPSSGLGPTGCPATHSVGRGHGRRCQGCGCQPANRAGTRTPDMMHAKPAALTV